MTGIGCHRGRLSQGEAVTEGSYDRERLPQGRLSQGEAVTEGSYDRESLPQGEAVAGGGCHRGKL